MHYLSLQLLSLVACGLGVWDKIFSKTSKKARILGIATLLVVATSLTLQGFAHFQSQAELAALQAFTDSELRKIDEASGAAASGDTAYVVDDEKIEIHVFGLDSEKGSYEYHRKFDLVDSEGAELGKDQLDDFEAASCVGERLYVATSHSNTKGGDVRDARQRLIEVSIRSDSEGVVLRSTNLRPAIAALFERPLPGIATPAAQTWVNAAGEEEVMNIEGMAIDPEGRMYLGLRSPLVDGIYALVLRAPIDEVFSTSPQFEAFALDLQYKGEAYGAISMEYDRQTDSILLLSGSPYRVEFPPACLWQWRPGNPRDIQHPDRLHSNVLRRPDTIKAKPEALLVPDGPNVHFLLDAEYYGGQRVLERAGLKLTSAP